MRGTALTVSVAVMVVLGGCSAPTPSPGEVRQTPGEQKETTRQTPSPQLVPSTAAQGKGFTRRGVVSAGAPVDLEIKAVERHRDLTALKMELSINTADFHGADFGLGPLTTDFAQFWLLDPVGRKLYFTLREQDGKKAFGTRKNSTADSFRKGTRYPAEVYFPPLPAGVKQVTVLAMAGLGELTGIPVTDDAPPPVAKPGEEGQAEPGGVFQWPVTPPTADAWSYVADVQEYVETPERSVTQQGEDETVALRTDVLFAFDQATLSPKAASILRDVAQETRERADPAKPPIKIEGHTDSKGEDAYNQRLSERRAKAVRDYLARMLGVDYTYRATGKGEREPIAKNERPDGGDSPEGRARNRRVEISYKVKNRTPDMTVTLSPSATTGAMAAAEPAPFRGDDLGPVVGSLSRGELRLDVHPLYRDGALLVAPFEIENTNKETFVVPVPQPFSAVFAHEYVAMSPFSAITLVDEATKARYFGTRTSESHFLQNGVTTIPAGSTQRGYIYFPAPPEGTTSMTFDVKDLGTVRNVPISR
ncbi:OmpA family protein [Streptosporangium sandarakinum]